MGEEGVEIFEVVWVFNCCFVEVYFEVLDEVVDEGGFDLGDFVVCYLVY